MKGKALTLLLSLALVTANALNPLQPGPTDGRDAGGPEKQIPSISRFGPPVASFVPNIAATCPNALMRVALGVAAD